MLDKIKITFFIVLCAFSAAKAMKSNQSHKRKHSDFIEGDLSNQSDAEDSLNISTKKFKEDDLSDYLHIMQDIAKGTIRFVDFQEQIISYIQKFILERDSETGNTLLHMALHYNNEKLIALIINNTGVDQMDTLLQIRNESNYTPLHIAVLKNNIEFLTLIFDSWFFPRRDLYEELYSLACLLRREQVMLGLILEKIAQNQEYSAQTPFNLLDKREYLPGMNFKVESYYEPSAIAARGKRAIAEEKSKDPRSLLFLNGNDEIYQFILDCQNNRNDINWLNHIDSSMSICIMLQALPQDASKKLNCFIQDFFSANDKRSRIKVLREYLDEEKNRKIIIQYYPYCAFYILYRSLAYKLFSEIPYIIEKFHNILPPFINTKGFLEDCISHFKIPAKTLNALLNLNPNINIKSRDILENLLLTAVFLTRADYINALLAHNSDVQCANTCLETPLGIAMLFFLNKEVHDLDFRRALKNIFKYALKYMDAQKLSAFITKELADYDQRGIGNKNDKIGRIILKLENRLKIKQDSSNNNNSNNNNYQA